MIRVLEKRRASSEIDRTPMCGAISQSHGSGIHAICRETLGARHFDVRRRESDLAPSLVTMHDHSTHFVVTPEKLSSDLDLATSECTTNRRRANGFGDAIWSRDQLERTDGEVVSRPDFGQQRDVA